MAVGPVYVLAGLAFIGGLAVPSHLLAGYGRTAVRATARSTGRIAFTLYPLVGSGRLAWLPNSGSDREYQRGP